MTLSSAAVTVRARTSPEHSDRFFKGFFLTPPAVCLMSHKSAFMRSPGVFLLSRRCDRHHDQSGRWLSASSDPARTTKVAPDAFLLWYFHSRQDQTSPSDFAIAFLIIGIPGGAGISTVDLGTLAILVAAAGLSVKPFFVGSRWRISSCDEGPGSPSLFALIQQLFLPLIIMPARAILIDPTFDAGIKVASTPSGAIAISSGGVLQVG